MRLTTSLAVGTVLVLVLAACRPGDDDTTSSDEPDKSDDRSATRALSPEEQARQDVVDAREAAWVAEMESYSGSGSTDAPRRPDNPALQETMTNRKLLHLVFDIFWNDVTEFRYDDWVVDVQSVTLPSDDRAWLETCITYYWEEWSPRTGKTLSFDEEEHPSLSERNPGVRTIQHTEEMWLTDEGWKLALSVPNFYSQDENEGVCPIDDTAAEISDQQVASLREDAERQYISAMIAGSHDDLSLYSGQLHRAITNWGPGNAHFHHYYCPAFPALWADEEHELPDWYDDAWHDVYERSWRERPERRSGEGHRALPQPSEAMAPCNRAFRMAGNPIPDANGYRPYDDTTTGQVVVEEITRSEDLPVVYLSTCRVLHFSDASYGYANSPTWGPHDLTVRAIEALRSEGGNWVLGSRWDIEVSEGATTC